MTAPLFIHSSIRLRSFSRIFGFFRKIVRVSLALWKWHARRSASRKSASLRSAHLRFAERRLDFTSIAWRKLVPSRFASLEYRLQNIGVGYLNFGLVTFPATKDPWLIPINTTNVGSTSGRRTSLS